MWIIKCKDQNQNKTNFSTNKGKTLDLQKKLKFKKGGGLTVPVLLKMNAISVGIVEIARKPQQYCQPSFFVPVKGHCRREAESFLGLFGL